jgi:hypothetical protein
MTDTAPEQITETRYRRGFVREDGMVFWQKKKGRDIWLTVEEFWQAREKERAYFADYRKNNREAIAENNRRWTQANQEKRKQVARDWVRRNPDYVRKNAKEWRDRNLERARKNQRNSYCSRAQHDVLFCITQRLRARIHAALKGSGKSKSTFDLLGATKEEVLKHLESQFLPGMSWENRSEWHIDHIVPVGCRKSEKHLHALFHYTNLRPLWGMDNQAKNAKIPAEVPENIQHLLPQNWNE